MATRAIILPVHSEGMYMNLVIINSLSQMATESRNHKAYMYCSNIFRNLAFGHITVMHFEATYR